jgi:hypothetical protein
MNIVLPLFCALLLALIVIASWRKYYRLLAVIGIASMAGAAYSGYCSWKVFRHLRESRQPMAQIEADLSKPGIYEAPYHQPRVNDFVWRAALCIEPQAPFDNFTTYEGTRDALAGLSLNVSLLDSRSQIVFTQKYDGLDYSDFVWCWHIGPGKTAPAVRMLKGLPAGEYTLTVSVISGCKGLSGVPVHMVARQEVDLYPLVGQFLFAAAAILALIGIACSTLAYSIYAHRRRDGDVRRMG